MTCCLIDTPRCLLQRWFFLNDRWECVWKTIIILGFDTVSFYCQLHFWTNAIVCCKNCEAYTWGNLFYQNFGPPKAGLVLAPVAVADMCSHICQSTTYDVMIKLVIKPAVLVRHILLHTMYLEIMCVCRFHKVETHEHFGNDAYFDHLNPLKASREVKLNWQISGTAIANSL